MTTAAHPSPTAGHSSGGIAAFVGLYRLFLRTQLSKGRYVLAGALGVLSVFVSYFFGTESNTQFMVEDTVFWLWLFGIGLVVPILSLVLGSASLGNMVADETLVYLWIRPVQRAYLAVAAWLSAITVGIPMAVIPLVATAALGTRGDGEVIAAAALAGTLAVIAYTGLFTFLGFVARYSLIWGLVYIFIWEGFIARASDGAARLAIGTYPSTVLAELTDIELPRAERAMASGLLVPVLVAAVALALTTWRLNRADVD